MTLAVCAEMVFTGLPLLERIHRIHDRGFACEIWGWTDKDADALAGTGATPFARAADTLALVRAVDSPQLRMNLDLYHAQIGEGNLVELVRRAAPYLGEVQVADVPGRCEPGTGEVNWPFVARALAAAGYDGVVAMEAFAIDPSVEGSGLALDRFRTAFTVAEVSR